MGSRPRWKMGREGKANPSFLAYCPYLLFAALLALGLTAQVQGYKEVKAFLIPHSHCDPGWLETYEGYHTRYVERILTEVMNSLSRSPDRRFVWAEISYFSRWFDTKSLETKQQVRKFVENGQLEFVEGGWVQPDEANTNFDILVNQLTEGHDYLLKNFGVRPRFAWQIDPFGHSSMTPTLAAAVGFDALVINRIHHNLKSYFKQTRHMEFVWQGSPTLGEQSEIFTHVLHTHYSAPQGFDFEEGNVSPVSPGQPQARAQQLANELKSRSNAYRTSNLLVTFGDDFKFQRAEHQFSNMDMLIQEINNGNYGVKIQYATLSEYFDAVFAAKADFPMYKGDFFPYADNSDSYWTGYYTTRPHLKGLTRRATSILHSAETAFALARAQDVSRHLPTSWDFHYSDIRQGRRDTALVQHHDGITGTAKPNVADDYTRRLNRAVDASHDIIADMTKHLLYDETQDRKTGLAALDGVAFGVFDEQGRLFQLDGSKATEYPLVYHNGLGWTRYQYVRVKVSAGDPDMLRIFDGDGNPVPVQTSPFSENAATEPVNKSVFFLNFLAEVPPLGVSTYFVRVVDHATAEAPRGHKARYFTHDSLASADSQLAIENEFLKLTLSAQTGLPDTLRNKLTGQTVTLDQKYAEYSTSRSGAYLFRPVSLTELSPRVHVSIVNGELMSEVVISLSSARKLTLRLYTAPAEPLSHPEVGGVLFTSHQVDAAGNREVVVRYNTDIPTADMFYTDNGLELQLRSRNGNQERSRAHIEASRAGATETQYYPSISIAMLRHPWQDLQFTVISSQAMGTTSHKNGGLELMLHRHLSQDDGRGLGEGVRDTNVVTIQQWLMVGHVADAEVHRRRLSLQQDHPLTPVTLDRSPPDFVWADHFVNSYSPLTASLPPNVHLLSLKARDAVSSEVILRLIHIAEGIDSVASPDSELPQSWQSAATVKLGKLFSSEANGWAITHPRERSLSLNYGAEEVENRIRYDSSLGLLNMKIDTSRLGRGGTSQNTDEEGVFLSQAALDKMEQEKAASRKTLSIIDDADGDASYEQIDPIDDEEAYERDVRQRGQKRRVFDPTSVSVSGANQRQLLAVGKDTDPLKMLLRPLQMKSLLLLLEKTGLKAEEQLPKGEDKAKQLKEEEEEARRKQQQTEEEEEEEENKRKQLEQEAKEEEARRKQKLKKQQQEEEEEEQRRRKEEQLQHEDEATRKAEEERQEKEKQEESERRRQQVEEERRAQQKKEEEEARRKQQQQKEEEEENKTKQEEEEPKHKPSGKTDTTHTGGGRRAEASFPGVRSEEDVLAAEQRFLSTGLEAERMMMMFLTIVVISLMILAYLAFHRRHASAIISVSSLASATYPWVGNNGASGSGPSGRDFYRREMDQRLYSKMV